VHLVVGTFYLAGRNQIKVSSLVAKVEDAIDSAGSDDDAKGPSPIDDLPAELPKVSSLVAKAEEAKPAPAPEAAVETPAVKVAAPEVPSAPAASVEVPEVPSVDKVVAEVDSKVDEVVAEVSSSNSELRTEEQGPTAMGSTILAGEAVSFPQQLEIRRGCVTHGKI